MTYTPRHAWPYTQSAELRGQMKRPKYKGRHNAHNIVTRLGATGLDIGEMLRDVTVGARDFARGLR